MRKLCILGIGLAIVLFSGCATISNQPSQKISVTTNTGEQVVATINGQKINLPAQVKVSRSSGATVQVLAEDNPGYETTQTVIVGKQQMSGWFWGNILTWGTTGSAVDALTGSMWTYSNPNLVVPVKKAEKKSNK